MHFHIKRPGKEITPMFCGVSQEEVYNSLQDHLTTIPALENAPPTRWREGDSVCLACVLKVRPMSPTQLRACRDIKAGEWVVLCGCGRVRPYGTSCGGGQLLPLDKVKT